MSEVWSAQTAVEEDYSTWADHFFEIAMRSLHECAMFGPDSSESATAVADEPQQVQT